MSALPCYSCVPASMAGKSRHLFVVLDLLEFDPNVPARLWSSPPVAAPGGTPGSKQHNHGHPIPL